MKKYIYFYDTDTIYPCRTDDDAFIKIASTRSRTPDRRWALIEETNNEKYKVIIYSHPREVREQRVIIGIIIFVFIAIIFFAAFYLTGRLF